jgi:uncharacterized protein YciI
LRKWKRPCRGTGIFCGGSTPKGAFSFPDRKNRAKGGVILSRSEKRTELEAALAEDPFQKAGVAEYTVLEFRPTFTSAPLAFLKET